MSKKLSLSAESDKIDEKSEENEEIREIQYEAESDAEYGGYADEDDIAQHILNSVNRCVDNSRIKEFVDNCFERAMS